MNSLYRNDSPLQSHSPAHSNSSNQRGAHSFSNLRPHISRLPLEGRVRGDDGRFISRTDMINPNYQSPAYHRAVSPNSPTSLIPGTMKVCGWCRTASTSQWRVGPTTGSLEMATLCNACGINYRRALTKTPNQYINLDRLAQQTGSARLSIQKALKRQRKVNNSLPPTQSSWQGAGKITVAELLDDSSTAVAAARQLPLNQAHQQQLPPQQEKARANFNFSSSSQSSAALGRHMRNNVHGGKMSNVSDYSQHVPSRVKHVNSSTSLPSFDNLIGHLRLQN